MVLPPRRVSLDKLKTWAEANLKATDRVALESTSNAGWVHDLLKALVADIVIVNSYQVKIVSESTVKTDKRDTLALARLHAAKLLPTVWMPPKHVRELRTLTRHRQQLVKQRTAAKNRLRSLLHTHNVTPPGDDLFGADNRSWWAELPLSATEKLCVRHDLDTIDHLSTMIGEAEAEMARLSTSETWADQVPFLIQLPGIGLVSAMTILGAVGDISRFPSAKKFVGSSVHDSDQTRYTGRITKQGRRELRHADLDAVRRKFLRWASEYRLATSLGLSRSQFVQLNLEKVGLLA